MNKCTICDCDFSEDDGVVGTLGVIEVEFCNYCLVALEDMLGQKKELEKQDEPVGKFAKFTDGIWREVTDGSAGVPLYTTPQTKEWVGLMRGVRAEGDFVIIKVNGGNDEARFLCEELINEMAIYKEKT